ncbi:hypothetical protein J3E68DRAFT_405393 [Trichoderma sp. SZMC 28012]
MESLEIARIMGEFPQWCYTRCFLFSILASLLPVKALFVVSFLFHMIWNGLLPGFTGVAGKKCPDEVMQSGEMCRFGFCDIRWEDESIAVRVEGARQSIVFLRWRGLGFLACIQRERVNTTTN